MSKNSSPLVAAPEVAFAIPAQYKEYQRRRLTVGLRFIILMLLAIVALIWSFIYQLLVIDPTIVPPTTANAYFEYSIYRSEPEKLLGSPTDIEVRSNGELYVADSKAACVFVYKAGGIYDRTIGVKGPKKFRLKTPVSIAVSDSGRLYVVDSTLGKIIVYDEQELPIKSIEFKEEMPLAVEVGSNQYGRESLYVTTRSGIVVGTLDGEFTQSWIAWGREDGQFDTLVDIDVSHQDSQTTIYVADSLNYRIQALSSIEGTRVVKWVFGNPLSPGTAIRNQDASRKFGLPVAISLGSENRLYVLDGLSSQMVVLGAHTGQPEDVISSVGRRDGELSYPKGMAVHNGKIYVADSANARVSVFSERQNVELGPEQVEPKAHYGWVLAVLFGLAALGHAGQFFLIKKQRVIIDPSVAEQLGDPDIAVRFSAVIPSVVVPFSMAPYVPGIDESLSVKVIALKAKQMLAMDSDMPVIVEDPIAREVLALALATRNALLVVENEEIITSAHKLGIACSRMELVLAVDVANRNPEDN